MKRYKRFRTHHALLGIVLSCLLGANQASALDQTVGSAKKSPIELMERADELFESSLAADVKKQIIESFKPTY